MTSTTVQMATETTVVQVVDGEATVVQTGVPVTVTTTGGGGGVTDATYVTLSTNGTLTDERVLTAGTGITITDAGAGSTVTVGVTANTYQPLDSDLTAIAALSTTSFGRALLELADAAAGRTALGLGSLATASTITTSEITDGTIVNADISASAAIAGSKLVAATDTAQGAVELATAAETTTGTDATRSVTPDGLAGSEFGVKLVEIMASDMTTAITTGDGKAGFMVPASMNGMNLVRAHAALLGAQSSSGTPTVQIRRVRSSSAADMLSTKITIDANESTSHTAATAPVIDTANDDASTADLIYVDVDVAGTGAKGLLVTLEFQLP